MGGDAVRPPRLIPDVDAPLPEGDDKTASVQAMFDVIAPRYDLVNRVMTFRMDVGWRRRTVDALGLVPGSMVLDLACGTGDLARDLIARGHVPIGADLSFGMLAAAPEPFPRVQADGSALPSPRRGGRRRDVRIRAAELHRPGRHRRRAGPRGSPAWPHRVVGGGGATVEDHAVRSRHLLRPRRPAARRAPVRWRRLPLPPPFGGLPPDRPTSWWS